MKIRHLIVACFCLWSSTDAFEWDPSQKVFKRAAQLPFITCNSEWCDPSHEPMPNIVATMVGYNILKGNPFVSGANHDPGFAHSFIFVPTLKTAEGTYALHGGITTASTTKCSLSLTTNTASTVEEYVNSISKESSEGDHFTSNLEFDVSAEVKGVGISTTIPPLIQSSFESSKEFKDTERFITEKQGVVTYNDATCSVYRVKISKYDPPPFTDGMKVAIEHLNKAIKKSPEQQKNEFNKFINEFGTHFFEEVSMGARLSITRKYSMSEYQSATDNEIRNCNEKKFQSKLFGLGITEADSSCKTVENSNEKNKVDGFEREFITSYGSQPHDSLVEWSKQEFNAPLPIKMKLSPIINLFSKTYMTSLKDIDYKAIVKFMAPLYYNYCENNKVALGITNCKRSEVKGCGWNDKCDHKKQVCINRPYATTGYECCASACKKDTCQNGGSCVNGKERCGEHSCTCTKFFSGKNCETNKIKLHVNGVMSVFPNTSPTGTMVDFLGEKFPDYNFISDIYEVVSGDTNVFYHCNSCLFVPNTHGKNVVAGYARKNSRVPNSVKLHEIEQEVTSAVTNKGCSAKDSATLAYRAAEKFGYPIAMVHVVRFGHGLKSSSKGTSIFKNYHCKKGRHESSVVILFGEK